MKTTRGAPGRWLGAWLGLALAGYAACGLLGYLSPPTFSAPIGEARSMEALRLAFPEQRAGWAAAEGAVHHGWLYRWSLVSGVSSTGERYREQVLKVGWPFTMARGFVTERNGELRSRGALALEREPGGAYRFWPVQPVWPGLVIDSGLALLVLALAVAAMRSAARRSARRPRTTRE